MLSWADFSFLSVRFALAMAASISFFSARDSFFLSVDNTVHLLIQIVLPFQYGVEVVGLIGPELGPEEADADDVSQYCLQGLTVALIHGQQKGGEHDDHHHHCRGAGTDGAFEQKEERHAEKRTAAEAHKLPFCEVEQHFAFHFAQVLGDGNIGHISHLNSNEY